MACLVGHFVKSGKVDNQQPGLVVLELNFFYEPRPMKVWLRGDLPGTDYGQVIRFRNLGEPVETKFSNDLFEQLSGQFKHLVIDMAKPVDYNRLEISWFCDRCGNWKLQLPMVEVTLGEVTKPRLSEHLVRDELSLTTTQIKKSEHLDLRQSVNFSKKLPCGSRLCYLYDALKSADFKFFEKPAEWGAYHDETHPAVSRFRRALYDLRCAQYMLLETGVISGVLVRLVDAMTGFEKKLTATLNPQHQDAVFKKACLKRCLDSLWRLSETLRTNDLESLLGDHYARIEAEFQQLQSVCESELAKLDESMKP